MKSPMGRNQGAPAVAALFLMVGLLLGLAGCASRQAALPAPTAVPISLTLDYHAGTILSGPVDKQVSLSPTTTGPALRMMGIAFEDDALAQAMLGSGEPLASRARLMTSSRSQDGVVASGVLLRDVRLVSGPRAGQVWQLTAEGEQGATQGAAPPRWAQSPWLEGLLADEAVMQVRFELIGRLDQPGPRQLTVSLRPIPADFGHPGQIRLGVTLGVEESRRWGSSSSSNGASQGRQAPAPTQARQETAIVELPMPDVAQPLILMMPFDMPDSPWATLAVVLHAVEDATVSPASEQMMLTQATSLLEASRHVVAARPVTQPAVFVSDQADLAGTAALLAQPAQQRAALVYLAERTGAVLMGDLALVADDLFLELLATRIGQRLTQTPLPGITMGWVLDRASFELVVSQLEQRSLSELSGVLATHLGDIASRPVMLEELLDALRTRQTFETRLLAENYLSLEDDAPSARVRAWQWLKARKLEPAGYDPLASDQDRRDALDQAAARAQERAAAAASSSSSQQGSEGR